VKRRKGIPNERISDGWTLFVVLVLGVGCGSGASNGGSSDGGSDAGDNSGGHDSSGGGTDAAGGSMGLGGSGGSDPEPESCADGSWDHDEKAQTECVAWTSCTPGEFVAAKGSASEDQTCSGCASGSFSAGVNAAACTVWTICAAGQYVSQEGSATTDQACAACAVGTYTSGSNQSACVPRGECSAGTRQTTAGSTVEPVSCEACAAGAYCAGGESEPQTCASGTWDHDEDPATACATKTACVAGQYVAEAGSATTDRTCDTCESETYSTSANAGSCIPWTDCEAGEYISEPGSTATDRSCATCEDGTYTSGSNQSACVPQGECAPGTQQTAAGSATEPPTCEACATGTYCAGSVAEEVPCGTEEWDHDEDPATKCDAKTVCEPGEFVADAGTATSDRTCDDCDPETYSESENAASCAAWTACEAGQFVGAPGSPDTDQTCSDCADGSYSTASNAASCATWTDCGGYAVAAPGTSTEDQSCGEQCASGYFDLGGCVRPQNCTQLHELDPNLPSGDYVIDPDGAAPSAAFTASCDMETDDGGWTLALNYVHRGGTNPELDVRSADLPLRGSAVLGDDDSATASWGHASSALMAQLDPRELRFFGRTSGHDRVMHFATSNASCLSYFVGGVGNCQGLSADYRGLAGHTTIAPGIAADGFVGQGDVAMTEFPFYQSGAYHWGIRGFGFRWELDDFADSPANDTLHQIWVRRSLPPADCAAILADNPAATSGVYTIDPDRDHSTAPFQAHCDMLTEGGGWTLAMKVDGNQTTFAYSADWWTNQALHNQQSPDFDTTEAKLETFNSTPFSAVLMRMQVPLGSGDVRSLRISHSGDSLHAVMRSNTYVPFDAPPARADWKALAGPTASLQYNCNRQGFNVEPGYSNIRIGILGNNEDDCSSPDSYIGAGGQYSPCLGGHAPTAGGSAGCDGDNGNYHFPGFVWVYVR
jgi:hypothetical protein